jgi:D-alanyl-lipoteichoic acid acyltransferase DltB (MBOAT superfamily)
MAIGISLMFNIILPINFNSPYKAKDIQDFWRRWHITLSRFLRDYIYIPLGGNKVSRFRNYINLFAVFFIGGVWHGASWMFIIWGALHGIAIVIHRIWKDLGLKMWGWMGWFITFNFVNVAWVFFRAKDFESVEKVLSGMVGLGGIVLPVTLDGKLAPLVAIGMVIFTLVIKNSQEWSKKIDTTFKFQLLTAILISIGILSLSKISEFLYFQF